MGTDEGAKGDVLLSIKYGIPNTTSILAPAISIIGFFKRPNGETITHPLARPSSS
jgi:hypothetical protein